ncbi:MAG: cytochrome c3 family protein [Vicinamibacterales bacterium]
MLSATAWAAPADAQPAAASACETCHRDQAQAHLAAPARDFAGTDVHRDRGFSCVDCHGGDAAQPDKARAKAAATGFRGKPAGQTVVAVCARCHGDAALMRKYAPKQRVDQAIEYATSVHGQRLAGGDTKVATCVSCHGAHGVRLVGDARSPVYPLNVAATCTTCHADAERMKGYTRPDGSPLPTDQRARYEKSVHHAAMTTGNDLSAPTCNDCHGNHGAAPPGVGAVANVCGTCHSVFATKFALSTHSQIFDRGCVECHGNHDIAPPTDAMLGTDAAALCSTCHSEGDTGHQAATTMRTGIEALKTAIDRSTTLVASAENAGIDMGDQSLALREAANHLTLARTEMHAFDPAPVTTVLQEGLAITGKVDAAGQVALDEVAFRKRGLAVSLGAILLVVVALALKVRRLKAAGR